MSGFYSRRAMLGTSAAMAAGTLLSGTVQATPSKASFEISLAEWSLHKTLFGGITSIFVMILIIGYELNFDTKIVQYSLSLQTVNQ